ncbi:glycosyltransferase [Pontibacter sp. E15-1]|uniref:glycosyltransferase n=1 Tax=Pontibacter sp. E15-1 TaxID=2919918 RepID=UPI001F502065|nr:glycosyltransferase [Pontibacter sp. E15-1]MCJ8165801.1 glycosyltransferase [Pontibacter sp. E15-1]
MPTILHIIETLGRGGAEVMFVGYINALAGEFENIVVYLKGPSTLAHEIENAKVIKCLNSNSNYGVPSACIALNKIIKAYRVDLIHSHLYWPTIVARGANLGELPHIFSVHTLMTDDAFVPNRLSKYLEKLSYTPKQKALFVSGAALADYQSHINLSGNGSVLYNFVRAEFFSSQAQKVDFNANGLKLVTVGNLRPQKGHMFLVKCLQNLTDHDISLDIYGEGHQRVELETYIAANKITNVRLMGSHPAPESILKNYDAFVLASHYEGFCLAMAEAMAVGLPCIVSGIDVLREVSKHTQLYFSPGSKEEFTENLLLLYNKPEVWLTYSESAKRAAACFTIENHIRQLTEAYREGLNSK